MSNKERWVSSAALLASILPFILLSGAMQILPDQTVRLTLLQEEHVLYKYQFLYLGFMGFVPALLVLAARLLRQRKLVERNFMFMAIAALALGVGFLLVTVYGVLASILYYKIDLLKTFEFFEASVVAVSLLCGMLANFLPVLKRNDVLGIKNRYTLADNRVWIKVHYVSADVFMLTLFLLALLSSVVGMYLDFRYGWVHLIVWVAVMTGLVVWSYWYSAHVSKRLARTDGE